MTDTNEPRRYRVTLDITVTNPEWASPDKWDSWEETLGDDVELNGRVFAEPYVRAVAELRAPDDEDPAEYDYDVRVWTCSRCGSDDFEYHENYSTGRALRDNAPRGLTLAGDFEWGDGDDDPGVVCASCGAHVAVPEACTIDYE